MSMLVIAGFSQIASPYTELKRPTITVSTSNTDTISVDLTSTNALLTTNNAYLDSICQEVQFQAAIMSAANFVVPSQGSSVTFTSTSSLTISGLPWTIGGNPQILYVHVILADSSHFYANGFNCVLSYSGGVVTITGTTETVAFPTTASFAIGLIVPPLSWEEALNALRVQLINAPELKMTSPELLINDADEDSASVTSAVFELAAAGYNKFAIQKRLSTTGANDSLNMHIYGTNNPNAVSTSLSWWDDITTTITTSSIITVHGALQTDSIPYNRYESLLYKNIMIRIDYWTKAVGTTEDNEAIIYLIRSN